MKTYIFSLALFLFPLFLFAEDQAEAKKEYTITDFIRVVKAEGKKPPISMDTAIAQFAGKSGVEIDLISAVHVGDKAYYEQLNKEFKKYDAVLYELVASKEELPGGKTDKTRRPKKGEDSEKGSSLSGLQSGIGKALDLDFQLDIVNYKARNMVHADLSPDEFAKRVMERGDVLLMLYRAMVLGAQKSSDTSKQNKELQMQGRMLGSLFSSNPSLSLKRLMAKQVADQSDDLTVIIGSESAIITDRNAAALEVLKKEMEKGRKKIAIFYGGAHLADFAKSLEKDFGMQYVKTDWIVAWDLTKDKSARKE